MSRLFFSVESKFVAGTENESRINPLRTLEKRERRGIIQQRSQISGPVDEDLS